MDLISPFVTPAAISAVVSFAVTYALQWKRDVQMAKVQSELSKVEHEHHTRFAKLHEDRAEIIKRLYALIHKFFFVRKDISAILSNLPGAPNESVSDLKLLMTQTRDAFDMEYRTNRIFFTPQQNDLMDEVLSGMTQYELALFSAIEKGSHNSREFTDQSNEIVRSKFGPAQRMLEGEFRNMLGVEV